MKKHFKFATVAVALLMVTAIVVTFEACRKDASKTVPQVQTSSEMNDVDRKISEFGERMKQAAVSKSDETMPVGEALSNLTNYQNFKMCDAKSCHADMVEFTVETSIPTINGSVTLRDINTVYETSRRKLLTEFYSMDGNHKYIYCIISKAEQESKSDSLTVVTRALMSDPNQHGYCMIFDSTGYWYDCCGLGKCDIYEGQCIGRDAMTELNNKIHGIIPSYAANGGRLYFYDFFDPGLTPYDIEDPNSASGYFVHVRPWDDSPWCLSPDDLNHYLYNMIGVLNGLSQEQIQYDRYLVEFYFDLWSYKGRNMAYMPNIKFAKISVTPTGPDF